MNSFYWFHLLFLFILLLPVLSFLFTLRKPLRRSLLAILLVQAGGILLYLLCMPPLYWVCAQADFSHFYGILDFWRQDSAILLVPGLRFHLSHGGVLPDPLDRRGGAQKKAVITIFLGIYPLSAPRAP